MAHDDTKQEEPGGSKGKGKELNNDPPVLSTASRDHLQSLPAEPNSNSRSALSRLAASTAKLTNDLVVSGQPHADYMNEILAPSKAGPSSAAQGPSTTESSLRRSTTVDPTQRNTFQTTHSLEHVNLEEASFTAFLGGASALEQMGPRAFNYELRPRQTGASGQIATHSATDGMAVVHLLDSGYDEVATGEVTGEVEIPLTSEHRSALRRALFSNHEIKRVPWEDTLNFFPNFTSGDRGYSELSAHLGTSDAREARTMWIEGWRDVLSSYTDEVWGNLDPLVGRAKEELEDLSGEASPTELKALHRLQQILAHVHGS
ncbi:Uu.00g014740.m01.CDS01 [Anthostomella pinea]|uniref:Uu.00g014740.m01.CDS01 n=1 Tax=Anthostomella pinea TaxID=933095 RepID=A0AAI8YQE4_9PEZI|nr:Uu.00g014740.m01.CDS01 [Anthostomella pinea]